MPDIVYPQGCRPVTEDLSADELIRRLKTLAHTLQAMGQDEGMYQQFIPLALHLADDHFLSHESRDVQLLIACCIADVLRVYAPQAPYKDPERVKVIFMFLIKQLSGLKDPKDPAFKRYFYLLENLAYVKSFNMCFELEDCQEIFCNLFSLMFKIVNDEHSGKVKSFMLDVLCPLITESDIVSNELLDIILANIVEPAKSQKKNAYLLAKELVVKTCDTLEPYIQAFFNNVLLLGREEKGFTISSKIYDLIYELYKICPSVLLAVLPQLEVKLKSANEDQRLGAVSLLARMFSEKDSNLAQTHSLLWTSFLGRFNDINVYIRIKCVQYSMHFLLNHPELRKDITETLKLRQHDSEENVRYEVVMAIVSTAKRDFEVVSESEDLLEFVKERMLDKKFKIRKEAMTGLAMIYRKHLSDPNVPQATKKAVTWIKDKILHGYYMTSMEDRILVERLLNTSLVPFHLPPAERMKKLYYLLATIDNHATKAFLELQKHYVQSRRLTSEWLSLHRLAPSAERDKEISSRIVLLSKFLPDQVKAQEFLAKFSQAMLRDQTLLQGMEVVMKPDITCKECAETTSLILKKLGQPIMTNLYYNTVKMLLERTSSVMVDRESINILVGYVEDCLKNGNIIEEIGLHPNTAGEQGLKILVMLAYVYPIFFLCPDTISKIVSFVDIEGDNTAPLVMEILTFLGKYKNFQGRTLSEDFPEQMNILLPKCKLYAETGTPKQAKQAVRCLFVNLGNNDAVFNELLDRIRENLNPESPHYLTSIVSLGHLAQNLPEKFPVHIKNIVSRKIVKELLVKNTDGDPGIDPDVDWCEKSQLPFETLCKIEGLKAMGRWLVGLKKDKLSAQKTFRMLSAFIANRGDLLQNGKLSKAEMAWLRLAAGCAMLKICEVKCVGDQYHADQFYTLSLLAHDEVQQVREHFLQKFHYGLLRGVPNKCLPLDFMGMYAVYGLEKEKKLKIKAKQFMQTDISKRREYAKGITMGTMCSIDKGMEQLYNIMPDYMIVFAIAILAHSPAFTSIDDHEVLTTMRNCIWFILEPLLLKNDFYSFYFYRELLEKLKTYKDALYPDNETANMKIYALADLTLHLIYQKSPAADYKDFSLDTRIPLLYFKPPDDELQVNINTYIPQEFQHMGPIGGIKQIKPAIPVMAKTAPPSATGRAPAKKARVGGPLKKGCGPNETDVTPASASDTQIRVVELEEEQSDGESGGPASKKTRTEPPPPDHTEDKPNIDN